MGEKNLFYESPSVRKFHCVLLTLCADVSSLCCCFPPPGTRRPLAFSLWAASKMVIIINMGFVGGNTGGLEAGGGGEKKYFLYELFSPARQRKLPTSHSLVLSWGFRGTFTALYWRILYLKKKMNNEEIRWACCWQQRQEASALFWPALEGRGYSFKIIRRPSFPFFLSGNI